LNLKAAFSDGKFTENSLAGRDTECIRDDFDKGWVGVPPEDDDVTNHIEVRGSEFMGRLRLEISFAGLRILESGLRAAATKDEGSK
jgi:hypothetical protein